MQVGKRWDMNHSLTVKCCEVPVFKNIGLKCGGNVDLKKLHRVRLVAINLTDPDRIDHIGRSVRWSRSPRETVEKHKRRGGPCNQYDKNQ